MHIHQLSVDDSRFIAHHSVGMFDVRYLRGVLYPYCWPLVMILDGNLTFPAAVACTLFLSWVLFVSSLSRLGSAALPFMNFVTLFE